MSLELTGTLKAIMPTQTKGDFQFREVVVSTDETYVQDILIQFVKDKCAVLDSYKVGQKVKIGFNLRGRAWTSPQGEVKYFNTIQGWKINAVEGAPPVQQAQPNPSFPVTEEFKDEENDDLPF